VTSNHIQIRAAIEKAQENLTAQGTDNVDIKDVLLAGFGYISDCFDEHWRGATVIRLEGKRLLGIGLVIGGIVAAVMEKFV
jgi:hypothetical protein